jgi:hypothetical protein
MPVLLPRPGALLCTSTPQRSTHAAAGAGTPHKPDVVQPNGHVLHESTSCAQYLLRKGVSAKDILKEVNWLSQPRFAWQAAWHRHTEPPVGCTACLRLLRRPIAGQGGNATRMWGTLR